MYPAVHLKNNMIYIMTPPTKVMDSKLNYHTTNQNITKDKITKIFVEKFQTLKDECLSNDFVKMDLTSKPDRSHTVISTGDGKNNNIYITPKLKDKKVDTTYRIDHQTSNIYNLQYQGPGPQNRSTSYANCTADNDAELFPQEILANFLMNGLEKSLCDDPKFLFTHQIGIKKIPIENEKFYDSVMKKIQKIVEPVKIEDVIGLEKIKMHFTKIFSKEK